MNGKNKNNVAYSFAAFSYLINECAVCARLGAVFHLFSLKKKILLNACEKVAIQPLSEISSIFYFFF